MISTFPFKKIPGRIIIEIICFLGLWLNQEPLENGVSGVYSPKNIIMGQDLDYDKHCKIIFGFYVEAHEDRNIPNDMEEQTVSGICLVPTAKFQGSYQIFSLKTGRVVTRKQKIRETPIPTWVIQRVETLAVCDGWIIAGGNEPLSVDCLAKKNDFSDTLHEGGILVVAQ